VKTKRIRVCSFLLAGSLVVAALAGGACSSSSSSGGASAVCPAVGSKACPNDSPITQQIVSACETCLSQTEALYSCDPNASKTNCDSSGMSTYTPPAACTSQYAAVTSCVLSALGGDASTD
jgi:hypothetical protein